MAGGILPGFAAFFSMIGGTPAIRTAIATSLLPEPGTATSGCAVGWDLRNPELPLLPSDLSSAAEIQQFCGLLFEQVEAIRMGIAFQRFQ